MIKKGQLTKILGLLIGAMFFLASAARAADAPEQIIAHGDPATPLINGARVVGTTPGRPFIFMVAATGDQPLTFNAKNLPSGLKIDTQSGIITGSIPQAGTYKVELTVGNKLGAAASKIEMNFSLNAER